MYDVLEDACTKLKLDAEFYQLKHANKIINLADRISMLRLPQGAKLELVVKSKTPTAVTVALRLPTSEAGLNIPSNRVTAKVRNDTPIWKLLRHLEEADDAKQKGLNLTARGVPRTSHTGTVTAAGSAVGSGSGQIYWEMPVLKFAGRELSSLSDFRKTLSQVGIDNGSHQILLDFRVSDLELQVAMEMMRTQLDATGADATSTTSGTLLKTEATEPVPVSTSNTKTSELAAAPSQPASPPAKSLNSASANTATSPAATTFTSESVSDLHPVQVWSPPKAGAGMPAATLLRWNNESESVFAPSIAQMKAHQRQLEEAGRNKRLKSDREIEEEKSEREAKAAAISRVGVRIRFPDGYTVMWSFANGATGSTLYTAVRNVLAPAVQDQAFRLVPPMSRDSIQDSADSSRHDLVRNYGMRGGMVVNFLRGTDVPAPGAGQAYVKPEVAALAHDIVIPQAASEDEDEDGEAKQRATAAAQAAQDTKKANKTEAMNKMSKFLRLAKK